MNPDHPRLIEVAFPLKQASLDSVHEKSVRHGHISTLHIWPARRPLAACRAALIATLLPDPGTPQARKELLEKIGGKVVTEVDKKNVNGKVVEIVKERTKGGVLRWGNQKSQDIVSFREQIREAYGGRAPRVLDPFAGGGAIPLEAMRLGCEATAVDINPVAWAVLKCTLEHTQKLAGQTRPLPGFALKSHDFLVRFLKGTGKISQKRLERELEQLSLGILFPPEADLAWHVRAWGWWVLQKAKSDLDPYYPLIQGKPTVAYLWSRTTNCKNCRTTFPLLKSKWLCKKPGKRVLLTMDANADRMGFVFGVRDNVPVAEGNAAQRKVGDKEVGAGTMNRSGARCPLCQSIMTWDDLRSEGHGQQFGSVMLAVVVDGKEGKEYRLPDESEIRLADEVDAKMKDVFESIPFGIPWRAPRSRSVLGSTGLPSPLRDVPLGGYVQPETIACPRHVRAWTRAARDAMQKEGYPLAWIEAISAYLALAFDRLADYSSSTCSWSNSREMIRDTFRAVRVLDRLGLRRGDGHIGDLWRLHRGDRVDRLVHCARVGIRRGRAPAKGREPEQHRHRGVPVRPHSDRPAILRRQIVL